MLIRAWVLRGFWCPFLQTPTSPPNAVVKEGNNSAHCAADISLGGGGSSLSSCVSLFSARPQAWGFCSSFLSYVLLKSERMKSYILEALEIAKARALM